jgi:hypothetical protein
VRGGAVSGTDCDQAPDHKTHAYYCGS